MELDIEQEITHLQYLFNNKQLDEFIDKVEKLILPHIQKSQIELTHNSIPPHKQQRKLTHHQSLKHLIHQQPLINYQQGKKQSQETQKQNNQAIKKSENFYGINQDSQHSHTSQTDSIKQKSQQQNNLKEVLDKEALRIAQQFELQQANQQLEPTEINQNNKVHDKQIQELQQKEQNQLLVKQNISKQSSINKGPQKNENQSKKQPQNNQQSKSSNPITSQSKSQQITNALKKSKIDIMAKYESMKLIIFKLETQLKKLQTPMNEQNGWKINKIDKSSSLGVKTKGTLIQMRYQGIVQTNIENLCIMIYLSQFYKEWVPFCVNSKTISQPSPLEKIALMDLKIPFLTQRYSYLHGIAIDRITKTGKLYIYAQGISHQKQLLIQVHKADKAQYEKKVAKSVVLDAKFMVLQIGNEGNGKYQVKVYGMLDSHMPLLPQRVVNYIVKQLGGMIFDKIVKRANNFKGTIWEKQLKQNEKRQQKNPFYYWLHQRISNWKKPQTLIKSKI